MPSAKTPQLSKKIKAKTARVAVIGQGYVGLPLALAATNAGFFVYGFDTNSKRIALLKKGNSYIDDVSSEEIAEAIKTKRFIPTDKSACLKDVDIIIIAVPTPLDAYKIPDLTAIKSAGQTIAKYRSLSEQLVILESTTYPGTTEEILLPILTQNSSAPLYLAFSPERVDPGNKKFNIKNTPKVVGGANVQSTRLAAAFYSSFIESVVPVSSTKTAEMTKLLENIFRIVNISMVNELALLCDKMNIDIWEAIEAASTKPYGFMAFYPSPGVGGHCISIDPFYLSYKAREYGFFTRFIDLAGEINELMPHYVVTKVTTALNYSLRKSINKSKILLLGVAYKKDIRDVRESAAIPIAEQLAKKGAVLAYYDPYIPEFEIHTCDNKIPFSISKIKQLTQKTLSNFDLVLILADHSKVDYDSVAKQSKVVVDTRNAIKGREYKNVYRL